MHFLNFLVVRFLWGKQTARHGSSIGSSPKFDPHVHHILSWRLSHEKNSMAILPLRWFKKSSCQWLAKECALSTGKLPRRLAQEQCGKGKWPCQKWPKMCWRTVKWKSNQKPKQTKYSNCCRAWTIFLGILIKIKSGKNNCIYPFY